jgi:hypothetical protein
MKLIAFITSTFILAACGNINVPTLNDKNIASEAIIQKIKQIDRTITDSVIIEDVGAFISSCNGAELWGYYNDIHLVKIHLSIGMSFGITDFDFYFSNDSLIYAQEDYAGFYMDETGELKRDSIDIKFKGQYYFSFDSLINQLSLGHNRFENDSIDIQKTLLTEAYQYRDIIKKVSTPPPAP